MELLRELTYLEEEKEIYVSGLFNNVSEINEFLDSYFNLIDFQVQKINKKKCEKIDFLRETSFLNNNFEELIYHFSLIDENIKKRYKLSYDDNKIYYSTYLFENSSSLNFETQYIERYRLPIEVNNSSFINEFYLDFSKNFILDNGRKVLIFKDRSKKGLSDLIEHGFNVTKKVDLLHGIMSKERYRFYDDYTYK
ncbi:MAG: hypothetical protein ACOCRX_01090 [Candidatus Woesearchaeota archaeon]